MQWQIDLPYRIQVGKKNFYLNLNQYRNAHYHLLNNAKVKFTESVTPLLTTLPRITRCRIHYTYYAPSRGAVDVANVCSIVDKFFCDTLVTAGKLKDDNYHYLDQVTYSFGGVEIKNPRITATITLQESLL